VTKIRQFIDSPLFDSPIGMMVLLAGIAGIASGVVAFAAIPVEHVFTALASGAPTVIGYCLVVAAAAVTVVHVIAFYAFSVVLGVLFPVLALMALIVAIAGRPASSRTGR
jgi:hypothetical protein